MAAFVLLQIMAPTSTGKQYYDLQLLICRITVKALYVVELVHNGTNQFMGYYANGTNQFMGYYAH
jgi:hypothetical protein